jgi:uncharacterized protein (TIGR02270 family)
MLIADIIEQHWEEAGLLWARRCLAARNPSFSLDALADLDERLEAHLDGLRISGAEGWDLCMRLAQWEDPGEAFTASVLALQATGESRFAALTERAQANPALARGFASALGWIEPTLARDAISTLLQKESPVLRRIGCSAAALHRLPLNGALTDALRRPDEALRSRACRAVGELGQTQLASALRANLQAEPGSFWTAWSLMLLGGDPAASTRLHEFLAGEPPLAAGAAEVLFRRLDLKTALAFQKDLAKTPERTRLAICAAAAMGDPALIPWLLECMAVPETLRLAADAFQTITGADFVMERLRNGSPPRPTVPEDTGLEYQPDPDADLVWPNLEAIRKWWEQHRSQFSAGSRYLLGKPMSEANLQNALREGRQHQRAAAALELAIRNPGQPLFNIAAPAYRQSALLAQAPAAAPARGKPQTPR